MQINIGEGFAARVRLPRLSAALIPACRRLDVLPTRWVLTVCVRRQRMALFEKFADPRCVGAFPDYYLLRQYRISTSRFGIGQKAGSNQTPLGLHRIVAKAGGGWPVGTAFKSRQKVGCTWQGQPNAPIAHRILWLEGLEPGLNRGGDVDTRSRFIYIHGIGDETTLGRPASCGCVHLAAQDLMPLYDWLPHGTLVWIEP